MGIQPYVVYLSSSAHSNWKEPVKAKYTKNGNVIFVGPCEDHGLSDAMGAPGDIKPGHKLRITQMLNKSNILFGYIPDDRYRSFNIMLEIGIAHAKGKKILFVNEARSLNNEMECVQSYIDQSFDSLSNGLDSLHQIITAPSENGGASSEQSKFIQPSDHLEHKIFLSGSPSSAWGNRVKAQYQDDKSVTIITGSRIQDLAEADILFACRTDSEGRLFNLALAVGYANALGKQILFINQGDHYSHAYDYVKPFADGYFTTLDEGLRYLDYAVGIEDRL